jgi:SAM-dependent methyltransferase
MNLEHITCDLCGTEDYIVRYRKPDNWLWSNLFEYPVVECPKCGLVYVNPRPTFVEMRNLYPADYHDERGDNDHLQRYKAQFEYISEFKGSNALDIGCAKGDWLNYIHDQWPDIELHGVDAFSDGVNGSLIEFHKAQLPEANLPESYFDLITSWAVLEHVHTPNTYFSIVSRILKTNGKFVFLVTNSESIYGKYAYQEDIPRHLYHFSERTLTTYALKHGLKLESISYEERFWDCTGKGAVKYGLARVIGISWRDIYKNQLSFIQRTLLRFGTLIDKIIFGCKWERLFRRSGIIVVTMSKSA